MKGEIQSLSRRTEHPKCPSLPPKTGVGRESQGSHVNPQRTSWWNAVPGEKSRRGWAWLPGVVTLYCYSNRTSDGWFEGLQAWLGGHHTITKSSREEFLRITWGKGVRVGQLWCQETERSSEGGECCSSWGLTLSWPFPTDPLHQTW